MLAYHGPVSYGGTDDRGMRQNSQDTFEGPSVCAMRPLVPAKPVKRVSFTSPETGNVQGENGALPRNEMNDCADMAAPRDLAAAKAAVVWMGVPEPLVQLLLDLQPLEPQLRVSSAQDLFLLACRLTHSPQEQARLFCRLQQHRELEASGTKGSLGGHAAQPGSSQKEKEGGQGLVWSNNSIGSSCEGEGQKLPAGMSEGSAHSPAVAKAVSSQTTTHTGAAASEHLLSEMVEDSEACAEVWASWPTMMTSAAGKESSEKSPALFKNVPAELPNMTLTNVREEKKVGDQSFPNGRNTIFGNGEEAQSDVSTENAKSDVSTEGAECEVSTTSRRAELKDRVRRLADENWRLSQRQKCRACRKVALSDSGVTFLPCGHFITCETCSDTFDDCPACGKVIMGTVRTFLC